MQSDWSRGEHSNAILVVVGTNVREGAIMVFGMPDYFTSTKYPVHIM